jgi:hypothetical protein
MKWLSAKMPIVLIRQLAFFFQRTTETLHGLWKGGNSKTVHGIKSGVRIILS